MFSALGHRLDGWDDVTVLDLFAGSGAFGLEAISRGATRATAVEIDRKAAAMITKNAENLKFALTTVCEDVNRWVARPAAAAFDVIFIDPPYDLANEQVAAVLDAVCANGYAAPGTVFVVERSFRTDNFDLPAVLTMEDQRRYGDTRVHTAVW